jgi:glycosyltransferase involved in cell wall biosynthesis
MHRALGTWQIKVTRYIALNEFCRHKFIRGGLPAARIIVKPNFVDFDSPAPVPRSGFLFVGRLSAEKGIAILAAAANASAATRIRVAGTGPEAARLENVENIDALGAVDLQSIQTEMSRATALILPSVCYESFPRTVVEAFASRLPVIASRRGALAELVTEGVTGLLFEPGNADELAKKIQWAQEHPEQMAEMGRNARTLYESTYTSEHNYRQLMSIYESAILEVKGTSVL